MDKRHQVDARGLHCPLPVLRTRAALENLAPGEELTVFVTDPASVIDFPHLCNTTGHTLIETRKEGGEFIYRIRHRP